MKSIFRHTYIWALAALLAACHTVTQTQLTDKKTQQYPVNNTITDDKETDIAIQPYKDSLDKIMHRVLAVSELRMDKGQPESILGNFISDLTLKYINKDFGGADVVFYNNGGFRNSLPQGNITVENIYELMPFDNELVILELNGSQMDTLFNYIARAGGIPVGGMKMKIQKHFPAEVYIGNQKFDPAKTYRVVTSDYLANGGDNMFFLSDKSVKRITTGIKIRDFLLQYIPVEAKAVQTLKAQKDGRITIVE
jgi:2',3'-cyclic-nucleotide 2'-phosphodiesterase (5'-nucleotidase family)